MRNSRRRRLTQEVDDGDITAGSAAESNGITTIVLVGQRSVGELAANDTRRVDLGAKCQSTGERECGEFPLPSSFSSWIRKVRKEGNLDSLDPQKKGPPTGNCRRAFLRTPIAPPDIHNPPACTLHPSFDLTPSRQSGGGMLDALSDVRIPTPVTPPPSHPTAVPPPPTDSLQRLPLWMSPFYAHTKSNPNDSPAPPERMGTPLHPPERHPPQRGIKLDHLQNLPHFLLASPPPLTVH